MIRIASGIVIQKFVNKKNVQALKVNQYVLLMKDVNIRMENVRILQNVKI